MKKIKNKLAITIVELIVVISILSILAVIGYVTFNGYAKESRDTARATDISHMKSALEIGKTKTGFYPYPSNYVEIKYNGTVLWYQGTFGKSVVKYVGVMNKVPIDPLTGNEYTYSLSADKNFYEIGSISESN